MQLHAATLSRTRTKPTRLITISLVVVVLVSCLAKQKRMVNRRAQERLDMEQFRHFATVFVKEDRETGKVAQKPSATFASDKVAHSCDKNRRCDIGLRLHYMHSIDAAYCYPMSHVAWSVCVCFGHTDVFCKTDEPHRVVHGLGWVGLGRYFSVFGGLGWVGSTTAKVLKSLKELF